MFGSGKKLGKPGKHILESLTNVTDKPKVIGKRGPTAKDLREMVKEVDAKQKIEEEARVLHSNVAKILDN